MRYFVGLVMTLMVSGPAFAGGPYIAVGGEVGRYETDFPAGEYTDAALNGRLGLDIGKYFGFELEGALNIGGAAKRDGQGVRIQTGGGSSLNGGRYEYDVKGRAGLFIRARAPITEKVDIFARGGLGVRKMSEIYSAYDTDTASYDPARELEDTNLLAGVGVGAEVKLDADGASLIRADLTRYSTYIGGEDQDVDYAYDSVLSVAYVRRF